MSKSGIKILGDLIDTKEDYRNIYELKFYSDNPRVYACVHGNKDFDTMTEEEQQDIIYKEMLDQPSVKNLKSLIERHGGLLEPILIRHDTNEVIEGNSRLAVYRLLYEKTQQSDWIEIECKIVSSLTDKQQAAYLSEMHIKGKTQWTPYEKANFAYVSQQKFETIDDIAESFGESVQTIKKRIKIIDMMKKNKDDKQSHFSYYDVLVRQPQIAKAIKEDSELKYKLLEEIKNFDSVEEENNYYNAKDMRDKLPVILAKSKVFKKYKKGELDLGEAYQRSKVSNADKRVQEALGLLSAIEIEDISELDPNDRGRLGSSFKKLRRVIDRIDNMIKRCKNEQ